MRVRSVIETQDLLFLLETKGCFSILFLIDFNVPGATKDPLFLYSSTLLSRTVVPKLFSPVIQKRD